MTRWLGVAAIATVGLLLFGAPLLAEGDNGGAAESPGTVELWTVEVAVDTLWVLMAGFLVFFMNAGFGCVEAGFCRAKNAVNILGKNFVVFGIASLAFWIVGWAIMFGDGGSLNSVAGTTGWLAAGNWRLESSCSGTHSTGWPSRPWGSPV